MRIVHKRNTEVAASCKRKTHESTVEKAGLPNPDATTEICDTILGQQKEPPMEQVGRTRIQGFAFLLKR